MDESYLPRRYDEREQLRADIVVYVERCAIQGLQIGKRVLGQRFDRGFLALVGAMSQRLKAANSRARAPRGVERSQNTSCVPRCSRHVSNMARIRLIAILTLLSG